MRKDRIICLVGESGSGKTTIAKQLEQAGYNIIHSYTTRAPRTDKEWGHTFVTLADFEETPEEEIIANASFADHYYWATREQYQGKGDSVFVIDPYGVECLQNRIKDATILVIYLKTDTQTRIARMSCRTPEEKATRILHDKERFCVSICDYVVDNNDSVIQTVRLIKKILQEKGGFKRILL